MEKAQSIKEIEVQKGIIEKQRQDELEIYLDQVNEVLVKIFQQYCSYGDPLNSDRLKSHKLNKIFADLGLIEENN